MNKWITVDPDAGLSVSWGHKTGSRPRFKLEYVAYLFKTLKQVTINMDTVYRAGKCKIELHNEQGCKRERVKNFE